MRLQPHCGHDHRFDCLALAKPGYLVKRFVASLLKFWIYTPACLPMFNLAYFLLTFPDKKYISACLTISYHIYFFISFPSLTNLNLSQQRSYSYSNPTSIAIHIPVWLANFFFCSFRISNSSQQALPFSQLSAWRKTQWLFQFFYDTDKWKRHVCN